MRLPERVTIVEVGPRDGLQNETETVPTSIKIELVDRLTMAGLRHIEVSSFVHPKWVPQLRDAEEVFAAIRRHPSVTYMALVPNERGYERALACGVTAVRLVVSASEALNYSNFQRTVQESITECERMIQRAAQDGVWVGGIIAAAFGCPYEGEVPVAQVLAVARAFQAMGVQEIILADTAGMGDPRQVYRIACEALKQLGGMKLGCHLHNTRNTGYANIVAAMQAGISSFDTSIGGLGGCPYTPGATGNVATEDTVHMLECMGVHTGVNLEALIEIAQWLQSVLGRPLPGYVMKAGPTPRQRFGELSRAVQNTVSVRGVAER